LHVKHGFLVVPGCVNKLMPVNTWLRSKLNCEGWHTGVPQLVGISGVLPPGKPEAIHEIHDRFALDERLTVERYLRAVNYGFETTGPDRSLIVGSTAFPRETYLWLKCPLRASSLVIMTNRFANSGNDVNWSRRWHK